MSKYFRTIAARGITPEYYGAKIGQNGEVYGVIAAFEHFSNSTVVTVAEDVSISRYNIREYDFEHLEDVEVYA